MKKSYWGIVKAEHCIGHLLLLITRLYWGGLLILAALGAFANLSEVISFFEELSVPAARIVVYLIAIFELLGGISLFFGFCTRIMTLPLVVIFVASYFIMYKESLLSITTNPAFFIEQTPFLFLYTTLIVLSFGPGMLSIDYWLEKRAFDKELRF